MNETIEALKFWVCAVADAYGPCDRDRFIGKVMDGLKASGVKIRATTYDAIGHLYEATAENRKWHDPKGS